MESIDCIFCKKSSANIIWWENGYTGKKCNCGLIYVSPRPLFNEIKDLYTYDHAVIPAETHIAGAFTKEYDAQFKMALLKSYLNKGRLLEVGAGAGTFLAEAKKHGFAVFANELNKKLANHISEKLKIPVETNILDDKSFQAIKFDCISHFDVLSHFYDPFKEFFTFHAILNDRKIMMFETGNLGDVSLFWLKFIGRLQYPDHLFFYSQKNIMHLCREAGFVILKRIQFSIVPSIVITKCMRALKNLLRYLLRPRRKSQKGMTQQSRHIDKQRNHVRKGLRKRISAFLNFVIRYRVGRIFPAIGPATVIYIVKKA